MRDAERIGREAGEYLLPLAPAGALSG